MAFRSRFARLAAGAALALPAAALTTLLPGAAAQATSGCGSEQAAIIFHNGSVHCQEFGRVTYIALREGDRIKQICAGAFTLAEVFPYGLVTRPVLPGKCELLSTYPIRTDVTVAALGF